MRTMTLLVSALIIALTAMPGRPGSDTCGRHADPTDGISRQEALATLRSFARAKPASARQYNRRGLALLALEHPDMAARDFQRATCLAPRDALAWCNLSCAALENHDYDAALKAAAQAVRLEPRLAEAYLDRAAAFSMQHRHQDAIRELNRAITACPDFAETWFDRSLALEILGHIDRARRDRAIAMRLDPTIGERTLEDTAPDR